MKSIPNGRENVIMLESMIVAKLRVRIEELEQELGAAKAQQKLDERLWQRLVGESPDETPSSADE